jgi:hypothetical protein
MASVVLPYAALTGDDLTIRDIGEAVLANTDREWAAMPTTTIPRALAAAGAIDLVARIAGTFRRHLELTRTPRLEVSTAVSEGLTALASGRPSEAVDRLQIAIERESELGWRYRAACLQLDLASALEAADKGTDAVSAKAAADAVLEPLRCVHPY